MSTTEIQNELYQLAENIRQALQIWDGLKGRLGVEGNEDAFNMLYRFQVSVNIVE
jgi:hypothetical protein